MNMKKTIAAVAAGAVAVSAMATTVSALEAKTLTYSLVQNVRKNDASGTITATFNNIQVFDGDTLEIVAKGAGPWDCVVTVSGSYQDINESILPTKFTKRSWTDSFSKIASGMIDSTADGDSIVKIPVVAVATTGKAVNIGAGKIKNLTLTVDYYNLPARVNYVGALNAEVDAGRRGVKAVVRYGSDKKAVDSSFEVLAQGVKKGEVTVAPTAPSGEYTYAAAKPASVVASAGLTVDISNYKGGDLNLTYKKVGGGVADPDGNDYDVNAWVDDADGKPVDVAARGIDITGTPTAADEGTAGYTATSVTVSTGSDGAITAATLTKSNKSGGGADATAVLKDDIDDGTNFLGAADAGGVTESTKNLSNVTFTYNATYGAFTATVEGKPLNIAPSYLLKDATKVQAAAQAGAPTNASTIKITGAKPGAWTPALNGVTVAATAAPVNGDKIIVTAGTGATNATIRQETAFDGAATAVGGNTAREIPYRSSLKNTRQVDYYQYTNAAGDMYVGGNNNVGGGDVFWKIGLAAADNSSVVVDTTVDKGYVIAYNEWQVYEDQNLWNKIAYGTDFTTANATNTVLKFWNDAQLIAQNARAVVNDAIANYSDVKFVFNTATKNVKVWTNDAGYVLDYEYTNDGATSTKTKVTNGTHNAFDNTNMWEQVIDYTSFGRHYWERDTGYGANTTYISNDWIGNNLFEGALIINGDLTLSLAATDKFDWTSTSLSFSWDDIQDAALTSNQYANYIQNMVLRTSADWYWDNLQVVLGETEEEDVGTTSPVEAEEEELEEEEPEIEEEPEEEPEVEAEPEPEPEPAPVVEQSPNTGNAPVALAVIPVALAAAAVVAKKRG